MWLDNELFYHQGKIPNVTYRIGGEFNTDLQGAKVSNYINSGFISHISYIIAVKGVKT
jgi:hypothetical protein